MIHAYQVESINPDDDVLQQHDSEIEIKKTEHGPYTMYSRPHAVVKHPQHMTYPMYHPRYKYPELQFNPADNKQKP